MLFQRITIWSTLAFVFVAAVVIVACTQVGSSEVFESKARRRSSQPGPAHQSREGVQKDLWTRTSTHTRHLRLSSSHSELQVAKKNNSFELTEHLQAIEGFMEDGAEKEIRRGSALAGTFCYPANRFEASGVSLTIHPANLTPPTSSVRADVANWSGKDDVLHLSGHVNLFSKQEEEMFAVADELFFYPDSGRLKLCGHDPSRVLFRKGDMRLSSPIVEMAHFERGKPELIQGVGDVHLHFNREETALFEKLFGF